MSFAVFSDFSGDVVAHKHDFTVDVIKVGIIDATVTPNQSQDSPTWGTYSAYEVSSAGGYTAGGIPLVYSWGKVAGVWTLKLTSFELAQNIAGFTDGAWLVAFNDTHAAKPAIGFQSLGGLSEARGKITIKFSNSAVGALGAVLTGSV